MTTIELPGGLPRPRRTALLHAAATLWVPVLAPVGLGMLGNGSAQAATHFWLGSPIVPGVLVAVLVHADGVWFVLAALLPTLALFLGLYLAAREVPARLLYTIELAIVLLVAFQAIGFLYALQA